MDWTLTLRGVPWATGLDWVEWCAVLDVLARETWVVFHLRRG